MTANRKAKQPLFDGDELAVRFVRTAIGPNTRPGLEVVRISTMSDDRGVALVRARTPFVPLPESGQTPRSGEFLGSGGAHARALSGDVFLRRPRSYVAQQLARRRSILPIAIRVLVRDAATQRTLAVSTATLLHVNAPAECARAKVAKDCLYPRRQCAPTPTGSRQMNARRHRRGCETLAKSSDGFILVAVLWILGGLAVLAAIYTLYVVNAATSLRSQQRPHSSRRIGFGGARTDRVLPRRREAARAADQRNNSTSAPAAPMSRSISCRKRPASISTRRRKPLLAGLFRALGASPERRMLTLDASSAGDRPRFRKISTWTRDKETTAYRNAGLPYDPRLAPFTNVQELWLVLGLPPALVERALHFVTVFSGMPSSQYHGCRAGSRSRRCPA